LTDAFITKWLERHPTDQVIVRDLLAVPIPHITDITIKGYYTPATADPATIAANVARGRGLIDTAIAA
jgi:FMN-dependent NADH-azoreductase